MLQKDYQIYFSGMLFGNIQLDASSGKLVFVNLGKDLFWNSTNINNVIEHKHLTINARKTLYSPFVYITSKTSELFAHERNISNKDKAFPSELSTK